MANKEKITEIIFSVIDDINLELPDNMKLNKDLGTVLFGEGSAIDSLALVNFVVVSEQRILEELDQSISLTDERAMSQKNSPFRTVETLVDYIKVLIEEN